MNTDYIYLVKFIFSKEVAEPYRSKIISEFVRLRQQAVPIFNYHIEKWNAEYTGPEPVKSNYIDDYIGTEYMRYIHEKVEEIIDYVNQKFPSQIITLEIDEVCDYYAKVKDSDVTVSIIIEPTPRKR